MRKFLLMAAAGLAFALAAPAGASAMSASPADAIKAAAQGISPEAQVAWHCRAWSGWCGRRHYRRYYAPRRHYWRRHYGHRHHWRRHHRRW